jgi:hypothetical protein
MRTEVDPKLPNSLGPNLVRLKELRSNFPGAGAVCDVQALQDGGDVNFHGAKAHLKLSRDLLVRQAPDEKFEHFEL